MKAHLAEWISKSVQIMNATKKEKVVHCWDKTGLLAIWDVSKRSVLTPVAFAQTARLFPGHHNDDVSGEANEIDDSSADRSADFGNKASTDFSSSISTVVNTESGVVTSQDAEEDAEIEQELVAAVIARAQTGVVPVVEASGTLFKVH
jgi:hypothetical protein